MSEDLVDGKPTVIRVGVNSHYINQCWLRAPTSYGVTMPQFVIDDTIQNYALNHQWYILKKRYFYSKQCIFFHNFSVYDGNQVIEIVERIPIRI